MYTKRKEDKMKTVKNICLSLKRYSFLLEQLISRDFKVKYKRSVLGVLWSKFWLTAKSEPDFQKTMAPWIGEAWNELSYRQMLEQAVAENDFKLAIRIRYGGLLHLMDEKGMIRWDAHKTNRSYYYELKDKALRDDFEKLAYIFDCVCYGDFEVSASLYGQLEPVFDEFRDKLKK
mgnify:CR=1 FL=1